MVNQRRTIAPRPATADMDLILEKLVAMENKMTIMEGEMVTSNARLVTMDSRLGVIIVGNRETITAIDNFVEAAPAAPTAPVAPAASTSATSNVVVADPIALSNPSKRVSTEVYAAIRKFMWNPKFRSTVPAEVEANNDKPRWNTDVHFNVTPNKELVDRMLVYLGRKFAGDGMRQKDLRERLHKNFISRCRKVRESPAVRAALNRRSRRSGRANENYARRLAAYDNNRAEINQEMGWNCIGALQKGAMSEGESDDEVSEAGRRRVVRTIRPSWRSNEFNRFIQVVDRFVVLQLGANAHQMLSRVYDRTVDVAVPTNFNPSLPQWALRHGL